MPRLKFSECTRFAQETRKCLAGGVHYNFRSLAPPAVIPFGDGYGSRVRDLDGNEHLDLFCKFGALIVGHRNQAYNEKLMQYVNKAMVVDQCDLEARVCERLVHHVPSAELVRFGLSGTESVQNVIRLARAYTRKSKFVRFEGHYHGNADNIMGGRAVKGAAPVPVDFDGDPLGTEGRAPSVLKEQSLLLPWNDVDVLEQLLREQGNQIAALIMEPICINGGGLYPRPGYLEKVRTLCNQYQVLLIFDEVITGFRVALGGAQSILGVLPDITVLGKAMAGGALPVSAIVGKKEILQMYAEQKVIHAGTFNGYPLGLAAVLATIEILEGDLDCYDRMGGFLTRIAGALVEEGRRLGVPISVQGVPTAQVFHSQAPPQGSREAQAERNRIQDLLITRTSQSYGIQFSPPSRMYSTLSLDQSDVVFFRERIGEVLADVKRLMQSI